MEAAFLAQCFAAIWAIAAKEAWERAVPLSETIGLGRDELITLALLWRPAPCAVELAAAAGVAAFDEEEEQLFALLDGRRADDRPETRWLARMITRRAMQPNHLWQDLGLANRDELNLLLRTKFPALAARNVDNMKWKKFFYRCLCEMEGFSLCTAPSCRECGDFDRCFGPEDGESFLARIRREQATGTLSHP